MQKGHGGSWSINDQYSRATKDNTELLERLREAQEKVKQVEDHMQHCGFVSIPHVPNQQLWDQLRQTEKKVEEANDRAAKAEENVKKMEDRIELAKTMIGALLENVDNAIQELKKILEQQWEAKTIES